MDVDASELRQLEVDFEKIPAKVVPALIAVGDKAAVNVKDAWRKAWTGLAHAPHVSRAVTYDRRIGVGTAEWEIGPDKDKTQGALGNLLEFGSVNNPPRPGGMPALDREEPKMTAALENVLGRILDG